MYTARPGHRLPRGGNRCDFCGGEEVQSLYSCVNFEWEGRPIFRSATGWWASCWLCSQYIETQQWGQLNRRVMRGVSKRQGITVLDVEGLRTSLKQLHSLFASNVVDGEPLKVHRPHVRRFVLTD